MAAGKTGNPLTSISTQLSQLGMGTPQDLISSILTDHESKSVAASSPVSYVAPPSLGQETPLLFPGGRMRSDSSTLKRTHWKPLDKTPKCANPACRKRFTTRLDRKRNCCMCGDVFCRRCTNFRRKLSTNAEPDPLGTFFHVCKACFDKVTLLGRQHDLSKDFNYFRSAKASRIKRREERDEKKPLCARQMSASKRTAIREEADRLTEGFQANTGWVRGLIAEVKIPAWQRCAKWVPSGQVTNCFNCQVQLNLMSRKIHCRICGQVFCTSCTKDEILLYLTEEGRAQWAVNGKEGGPTTKPSCYDTLPICCDCSKELQSIILGDMTVPEPECRVDFMEQLSLLQQKLLDLQNKLETWLPNYQRIVDSLGIENSSPNSVESRNPMHELIKAQSDLSDGFSQLAVHSQKLKQLEPQTETQGKLLRHVMIGTYQYYSENMYLFRNTKNRLSEFIPIESLMEIQVVINQQSMQSVHTILHQIMFEALNLEKQYRFDSSFFGYIIEVFKKIELEFKPLLEKRGESWESHYEIVRKVAQEQMLSNRKIRVDGVPRHHPRSAPHVRAVVISKCAHIVNRCHRQLQAKTTDREFAKTKASLNDACKKLDSLLAHTPN